jgi:diguanylate cyclase (GGDEF)-like protein
VPGTSPLSSTAALREALDAARGVQTQPDLVIALDHIAGLVGDQLGYRTVVINLHRPAWDDFETAIVYGPEGMRESLLGLTSTWDQWAPYLATRFERRGAHHVPAGTVAEQPDDVLVAVMRRGNGDVLGVVSVDTAAGSASPSLSDDDLDRFVMLTQVAALAVEQSQEAIREVRHRTVLERLLQVASHAADERSRSAVLDAVCAGIREALGFQRVAVLVAEHGGLLRPAAAAGWTLHDPVFSHLALTMVQLEPILQPVYARHGCYLLQREDAETTLDLPRTIYRSQTNGHGPYAWQRHWLVVPLRGDDGEVHGVIWVDDPSDRLIPDRQRLQALRLFGDQAAAMLQIDERTGPRGGARVADHDPLTGLVNRTKLAERLRHALQRVKRAETTVAVLFIDLDNFQHANDTLGHGAGDELLRITAARIDEDLRPGDTVARFGGDEFVALCEDVHSAEDAMEVAERLRTLLSEPVPLATGVAQVTASIGVALPDRPDRTAEALLQAADRAMYEAKAAGRDAARLATPGAGWP